MRINSIGKLNFCRFWRKDAENILKEAKQSGDALKIKEAKQLIIDAADLDDRNDHMVTIYNFDGSWAIHQGLYNKSKSGFKTPREAVDWGKQNMYGYKFIGYADKWIGGEVSDEEALKYATRK